MADERKYYCYCDNNCKYETMNKEQILAAIAQAVSTGEIKDVDTGFITTVKTVNNKSVKFFFGTEAEYNALGEDVRANLIPYKSDDSLIRSIEKIIDDTKADLVPRMAVLDQSALEDNSDRPYSEELDNIILGKDRVYVELKNWGGVMRSFVLTSDGEKVYNPFGYKSKEAMCEAHSWNKDDVKEGEHYIIKTIDGAPSYHSWLSTIVQRQRNGNVRVGTPSDSSDATPKIYVDGKFGGANVKAQTNHSDEFTTIPLRDTKGEMRCKIDDSVDANGAAVYSGDACVNKTYFNTRFGGANVKAAKFFSESNSTIPLRGTDGSMYCKVPNNTDADVCINRKYFNENAADKIAILNGDEQTSGSVKKTVADAIAKIVASAPEDFDTLKEMSDWISSHSTSAAAMNSAIQGKADSTHNHDGVYAKTSDIPSLDGYAKTGDIPTDEHINDLIDTALGGILNGKY